MLAIISDFRQRKTDTVMLYLIYFHDKPIKIQKRGNSFKRSHNLIFFPFKYKLTLQYMNTYNFRALNIIILFVSIKYCSMEISFSYEKKIFFEKLNYIFTIEKVLCRNILISKYSG